MDYQRSLEQKEAMFELVAQVSITLRISFLERILVPEAIVTYSQHVYTRNQKSPAIAMITGLPF
jgi:hypothetical protein